MADYKVESIKMKKNVFTVPVQCSVAIKKNFPLSENVVNDQDLRFRFEVD